MADQNSLFTKFNQGIPNRRFAHSILCNQLFLRNNFVLFVNSLDNITQNSFINLGLSKMAFHSYRFFLPSYIILSSSNNAIIYVFRPFSNIFSGTFIRLVSLSMTAFKRIDCVRYARSKTDCYRKLAE